MNYFSQCLVLILHLTFYMAVNDYHNILQGWIQDFPSEWTPTQYLFFNFVKTCMELKKSWSIAADKSSLPLHPSPDPPLLHKRLFYPVRVRIS